MVRIAGGLTHEEFDASPRMFTNINSTSPLKIDFNMLDGPMRMARRGQPVIVTPFTLSGAMAPITIPGAVMQQTAEALATIALLQIINPGTPVVYGSFTSNVDMSSGAPAFGTPEYMRATQISGQMARFYGLPLRASNACAANCPDAQAAWESAFSLWACVSAGVNVVYHAAGWLEGGLCASYEKFVMDCETLQQVIHEFLHDEAKQILDKAGCTVSPGSDNVRMDREFVMEQVRKAPSAFDITPRNLDRKVSVGGDRMLFGNVGSPPNCSDLDRGRRVGDRESYQDLIKLTQYFNCIHMMVGYPVEPVDIHPSIRHLDCLYDALTLTDKAIHAYSLGKERIEDAMEMVRIAGGLTHEEFDHLRPSSTLHRETQAGKSASVVTGFCLAMSAVRRIARIWTAVAVSAIGKAIRISSS